MRRIFVILLLIFSTGNVFASVRYNTPLNHPHYNRQQYYRPHLSTDNLRALEKYSMNRVYSRDYPLQRLERLENLAFGAIQYGDLETRYKNVENAILSRNGYGAGVNGVNRRNWLGNVANYFAGQATGITPSIVMPNYQSYSPVYGSDYANQRIEQFSNGIFGGGYNLMNQNLGNGSSVRILP